MHKIKTLGLDLGTNSIGWALVEKQDTGEGKIIASGTRILPMSQDILGKFDSGISISQTAERTRLRGIRRIRERQLLRRERLHRILHILGFLPEHYSRQIDFDSRPGQFLPDKEPKLAYRTDSASLKSEFIFKESFREMTVDFSVHQPDLVKDGKRIPYDWTIYYLRKKALKNKIEKQELAWLLLNFNQKRGYYQLRGEEEDENPNKLVEFYSLKVTVVVATGDRKNTNEIWYNVHLENGWIYRRTSPTFLDWEGKIKDFIVTTEINADGTVKTDNEGKEKRSFRAPAENDWTLVKKKTEAEILYSNKSVGTYIYDNLLSKPQQKVKGDLVRVIERKFYKSELRQILITQQAFHPELTDSRLYLACLEELYANNEAHRKSIGAKDFVYLFLEDIIFYQRPLKSKKSQISNCKFEYRTFLKEGNKEISPLKCIAKSHPLFQEFRLWQWLQNLKIYEKETGREVTGELLTSETDWVNLFDWLNERKEVDHKALLNFLLKPFKLKSANYRWNYVYDEVKDESKIYPCNETRAQLKNRLLKTENIDPNFLTKEKEEQLWHILYSVEDKIDIEKALQTFAAKNNLHQSFTDQFKKMPPFKKEYGSYSAKAIKKLLPLMRQGGYWSKADFHQETLDRIEKLISGEYDENIRDRVREKAIALRTTEDFKGLPQWLASYIVYDRHAEDGENIRWETANRIEPLAQHSLRNPIVEQVINETLQVVKSIWIRYGNGQANFFNEIHIELGREMKNPAEKRKQMTNQSIENENTNLRIKSLLIELLKDEEQKNERFYSPMQQEILKIYEEGVLNAEEGRIPDDILKISKQAQPSPSELLKYKLWLQQKYRSPYTGNIIPLNKLFTRDYDIEHIIPQSRYFDDSISNKVICETAVNKDKSNLLGLEYIKKNYGKILGAGLRIFTVEAYEAFVRENYSKSRNKMKKLLMEDIPESFVQRQLNDTRFISRVVKNLMSNIVREKDEQESISKNVVVCNGAVTSILRQDWGLNDVWNKMITPRFERLNELTKTTSFGEWTSKEGKKVFQIQVPLAYQKGFSKKRIDHRHHALDAIVIACAGRNHINYLNNENALGKRSKEEKKKKRYDLKHQLCFKKFNDQSGQNYKWVFYKPWDNFTQDTKEALNQMVVSFKQNLRVINKTVNYYQHWERDENVDLRKEFVKQVKGENWAIRKPMHKDTVSGQVKLKLRKLVFLPVAIDSYQMITDKELRLKISELLSLEHDKKSIVRFFKELENKWMGNDISKVEIYYWDHDYVASRVHIDDSFNSSKIESITDTGIQNIMIRHLQKFNEEKNGRITEHPELAFSADGLDNLNNNILQLNGGKSHLPIYKVRTFETKGNKFNIGHSGNKKEKYVEAAKGTNLFFAIYLDKKGKRIYDTIPLNIVVERLKQGESPVPGTGQTDEQLLMYLSPNDLVYVPDQEETADRINVEQLNNDQKKRIYKMVSSSGSQCFFVRFDIASPVVNKFEFSALNKMERTIEGAMIKERCIKLNVDRLGGIHTSKL